MMPTSTRIRIFLRRIMLPCIVLLIPLLLLYTFFRLPPALEVRATPTINGVHVSSNKLVDDHGKQVVLHGVNYSGGEDGCVEAGVVWNGNAPHDANSIQAMKNWNINTVRVPLNEDCWLGINGVHPSGLVYQQAVKDYVNLATQNGMYVILDLHWSAPGKTLATKAVGMADASNTPSFWSSVASTFKKNNAVLFDLFNEPYGISWSCWLHGGNCGDFKVAGMQQLVNTVRSTGATNVLVLSGLNWAGDLSGWLANKPNDPLKNIAASFHMYGNDYCTQRCWDSTIAPVMAQVPVIASEFAETYDGSTCSTSISNVFMAWMDKHSSSYLAWTWDAWGGCSALALISDFNGTPSYPWGTSYKAHLQSLSTTSSAPTINLTPAYTPSPSPSSVKTLKDAQGNVWTLGADQKVYENGHPAGNTANVIQLLYSNGRIYQESAQQNWWYWNGNGWTATSAPSVPSTPSTPVTQPTPTQPVVTQPTPTQPVVTQPTATPVVTQPTATPVQTGTSGKMMNVKVTFYAYGDNNPPGKAIAYPHSSNPQTVHDEAGGSGTYDDPVTMATDPINGWPIGTRIYVPFIQKYVVYEDSCGCDSPPHIDIWMNSDGQNTAQIYSCQEYWTRDSTPVEINPPPGRTVSTAPLFNTSNATCLSN